MGVLKRLSWWTGLPVMVLLLAVAVACGGGAPASTAPAPQQPAAPAQPALAAPAAEPRPAAVPQAVQAPAPAPAAPAIRVSPLGPTRATPSLPDRLVGDFGAADPKTVALGAGDVPKYGGIATWGVRRDPPAGFDMMHTTLWYDLHQMGAPVWGSGNLVRECLNDVFQVCPGLAESWEAAKDFTQFTFKMREGVQWHDGTPLTAEDVKFWLELVYRGAKSGEKVRRPAWYSSNLGKLQSIEVLDGNRLRITLASRNPLFLDILATPYYTVAHPRHLTQPRFEKGEVDVAPLELGMVGTGPFKFVKYDKGTRGQVRRYDRYWEKDPQGRQLPYLEAMEFAIFRDPAAMDAAIRVGRLDGGSPGFGYILTKERQTAYLRDIGDQVWFVKVPSGAGGGAAGVGFNLLKPGPWQDVRVRRAIFLSIDQQAAIDATAGSLGYVGGLLNPGNPFGNPDILTWPGFSAATKEKDRAEAKRLMSEAGYAKGFPMTFNCLTTGTWRDRCEYLQSQLKGLNIELKLDLMDTAQWTAAGQSLTYDAVQIGSGVTLPFPEASEGALNVYSQSPNAISKHEDPKIPAFFERLRNATGFDQRVTIWRELERYWFQEQVLSAPLAGQLAVIPYRSHVKGRIVPPEQIMAYMDFATVWLDK